MYREADESFEPPREAELPNSGRRSFAPVPLGFFGSVIALVAEFFGLFLLAWGMAPTSIGCGAGRAAEMTAAMLAIGAVIYFTFVAVGLGIMREARESRLRRRSFILTFSAMYFLGSLPLLALAPLFGSCFNF